MHSHPSGFTWGNTASSAIFVLPPDDRPPYLWWAGTFTRHCVDQALGIADTLLEQLSRGVPARP